MRPALVLAACLMLSPAFADPPLSVARLLTQSGAPGAAMGWIDGETSGTLRAGLRAKGHAIAVAPGDLWHIGSNTKSMTATLAARLVEQGTLRWEDTVGALLSDLEPHPAHHDTTLEQLLAHRAGLPANLGLLASLALRGTDADRDARADRRTYARKVLSKAPGPRDFLYSNAGYVVAGAMIEAATGEAWEELMRREVFAPLGMDSAGFGPPGRDLGSPDQPWGHRGWLGRAAPPGPAADNIPALGPAGRVHLSVADHLRYLRAHLERDAGFLSPLNWQRLHFDPEGDDYALGWALADGRLLHNGSNTLWFHRVEIDPATRRALVLALNDGAIARVKPAVEAQARAFFAR